MSSLGTRLKEARLRKHLTQMQAAKKLGISNGTLSGYERDYRDPDTPMLSKLSTLYSVSIDWLTGNIDVLEQLKLQIADLAGDPGSKERLEFARKFLDELLSLPQETQQSLYELIKNMPK